MLRRVRRTTRRRKRSTETCGLLTDLSDTSGNNLLDEDEIYPARLLSGPPTATIGLDMLSPDEIQRSGALRGSIPEVLEEVLGGRPGVWAPGVASLAASAV